MKPERKRRPGSDVTQIRDLVRDVAEAGDHGGVEGDLFGRALLALERCVPFDAGVVVLIEHRLEMYVSARPGAAPAVDSELASRIRERLAASVSTSVSAADLVVASERHDLPDAATNGLDHSLSALLYEDSRVAGLLMLFRGAKRFSKVDEQIVDVFAVQLSLLLGLGRARERIYDLAEMDDLTGVGNKRRLWRELPHEIDRSRAFQQPLSLLIFDIDDFKSINDSFGHVAGDAVISEICAAVKSTLRDVDRIARFGGDEFALILPHTDLAGARAVAERILYVVGLLSIPADESAFIRCSVSIGIAVLAASDSTAIEFLRRADERLYVSKRNGKNRYTS